MPHTTIRFTVRRKGGVLAGQTIEHEVPKFDWQSFKNLPNAEEFVKKAYFAAAQKLVREIHEGKNGTGEHHLQSMEALIARSLKFARVEIEEWCENRDWGNAGFVDEAERKIAFLKENLPLLSSNDAAFPEHLRKRAAEIVASIANIQTDPIANFLWVKLIQKPKKDEFFDLLGL